MSSRDTLKCLYHLLMIKQFSGINIILTIGDSKSFHFQLSVTISPSHRKVCIRDVLLVQNTGGILTFRKSLTYTFNATILKLQRKTKTVSGATLK